MNTTTIGVVAAAAAAGLSVGCVIGFNLAQTKSPPPYFDHLHLNVDKPEAKHKPCLVSIGDICVREDSVTVGDIEVDRFGVKIRN
jgi:hypothetical protein